MADVPDLLHPGFVNAERRVELIKAGAANVGGAFIALTASKRVICNKQATAVCNEYGCTFNGLDARPGANETVIARLTAGRFEATANRGGGGGLPEGITLTDKPALASAYAKPQFRNKKRPAAAAAMPALNRLWLAAPRAFGDGRVGLASAGSVFINVIGSPRDSRCRPNIVIAI
jgi:hypothetical protein